MAAFTHRNPAGSRFSDGSYGVYYAANTRDTALRETIYHRERFLRNSHEDPMELDMRMYYSILDGDLHDLRSQRTRHPKWYDPEDYTQSQSIGKKLRLEGSYGLVYQSVREPSGECAGIFRPPVLAPCHQGPHYVYVWNGARIHHVYQKTGTDFQV